MTCNQLPECVFLEKIRGTMPHTSKMVAENFCADRERCLMNELAKTMIEHLFEGKFPDRK